MKILAIHSQLDDNPNRHSGIDMWRVYWPLEELKKHVDWQIDYRRTFIPDTYQSPEDFTEDELENVAKGLGEYDIIFSSYQPSPFVFSLLKIVQKRYGTKYVLDDDDDVYNIEPDNPFWLKSQPEDAYYMQRMIELADYVTTTNKHLKERYQEKSKAKIFVLPNFIPEAYKNTAPKDTDKINIVYFGGAGHYPDLHDTGALDAIRKVMNRHKNVHFTTIGVPIDGYIPVKRKHERDSTNVDTWVNKVFPSLNADIAIGPLRPTPFSKGKSNIKWQESTRLGAAFVATDIAPYAELPNYCLLKVENTQSAWEEAIEKLVVDIDYRKRLVQDAQAELEKNWKLENNWQLYKEMFEKVKED